MPVDEPMTESELAADGYRCFETYCCPHCRQPVEIWWQSSGALSMFLHRLPDGRLQVHVHSEFLELGPPVAVRAPARLASPTPISGGARAYRP